MRLRIFFIASTVVVCCCIFFRSIGAVTATAEIYIPQYNSEILVAPGSFSSSLKPSYDSPYYQLVQPLTDATGCDATISKRFVDSSFYLIVSRGSCSFQDKQLQAYELGAKGVIVYNSLLGIYKGNNYATFEEYECDNGSGYVDKIVEPVYGDDMNSLMPKSCTGDSNCASRTCVLTNATNVDGHRRVCCAWDLLITMGSSESSDDDSNDDNSNDDDDVSDDSAWGLIPAVFMSMSDANTLMNYNEMTSPTTSLTVKLYARDKGLVYLSVFIIYVIAVCTVLLAAHRVANKERKLPVQDLKGSASESSLADRDSVSGTDDDCVSMGAAMVVDGDDNDNDNFDSRGNNSYGSRDNFFDSHQLLLEANLEEVKVDGRSRSISNSRQQQLGRSSGGDRQTATGGDTATSYQNSDSFQRKSVTPSADDQHHDQNSLEMTSCSAVVYIIFSSVFLILLYFFNITTFVVLLYLLAAAFACGRLVFYPVFSHLLRFLYTIYTGKSFSDAYRYMSLHSDDPDAIDSSNSGRRRTASSSCLSGNGNSSGRGNTNGSSSGNGSISNSGSSSSNRSPGLLQTVERSLGLDLEAFPQFRSVQQRASTLLAAACAIFMASLWFFNQDAVWLWLVQDFLGVCVCILCLSTLLLPNLKVASALLSLAFLYDVFFVFISPYVFSSSVMASVVSSGSDEVSSDSNYCEKYPEDEDYCSTRLLPMMIVVPSMLTYLQGESILGLGDVVLPGLLAVWAARHDVRQHGRIDSDKLHVGYFPIAMLSYGLGLLLANVAVYVFYTGQPALLYIVPCMLGSILYRAYRTDELAGLWKQLPQMRSIALPMEDEEELLLGRAAVVEAEAAWRTSSRSTSAGVKQAQPAMLSQHDVFVLDNPLRRSNSRKNIAEETTATTAITADSSERSTNRNSSGGNSIDRSAAVGKGGEELL